MSPRGGVPAPIPAAPPVRGRPRSSTRLPPAWLVGCEPPSCRHAGLEPPPPGGAEVAGCRRAASTEQGADTRAEPAAGARTPGGAPRGRGRALFTRCQDTGPALRCPARPAGPARVLAPAPPASQRPLCPAGRTAWLGHFISRSGDRGYGYERLEPRFGERRPDLGGWTQLGTRQGGAGCLWNWCRRGPLGVSLSLAPPLAGFGKVSEGSATSWKVR